MYFQRHEVCATARGTQPGSAFRLDGVAVESGDFLYFVRNNALSMASLRVITPPADCAWCLCSAAHTRPCIGLSLHQCDCLSGCGSCSPHYYQLREPLQSWRSLLEAMRRVSAQKSESWRVPTCQSGPAASRGGPGKRPGHREEAPRYRRWLLAFRTYVDYAQRVWALCLPIRSASSGRPTILG
jgi:hypothetical protein